MKHFLFIIAFLFAGLIPAWAQEQQESEPDSLSPSLIEIIDSLLNKNKHLVPGYSLLLVSPETTSLRSGGLANMEDSLPVTLRTRFQHGSIGKLLTAIAILQQVEKGKLDLHADISQYLGARASELKGLSLHCLLTHSCGLNDVNIGYYAKNNASLLPLEAYAQQAYPGLFQSPGEDISYSNYSYLLAGLIVEQVSETPFREYVYKYITGPMGMYAYLRLPDDYQSDCSYARGYLKRIHGFEETKYYSRHAVPAGSLVDYPWSMIEFVHRLVERNEEILSAASWELFYALQFTNHPLLNGYAYGMEQQNINGKKAWAKGGMLGGALSQILIIPEDTIGLLLTVNTSDDRLGEIFFKELMDVIFPDTTSLKTAVDISVEKYAGEYRNNRYHHETVENMMSIFRGAFYVYPNPTADSLIVYHNTKFHAYAPLGKGIFQCVDLPYEYMVFEENEKGEVTKLSRNLNIGGLSVPTTYEKTSWYNSPSFLNDTYGIIPLFLFSGILFFIISLTSNLVKDKSFFRTDIMRRGLYFFLGALLLCYSVHTAFGLVYALRNMNDFLTGYPLQFIIAKGFGYMMIPLWIGFSFFVGMAWKKAWGSGFGRIYLSLFAVAMLIHIIFLYYWDFL
jgi:CubicO group peptidase (beta-lactamase class C family)